MEVRTEGTNIIDRGYDPLPARPGPDPTKPGRARPSPTRPDHRPYLSLAKVVAFLVQIFFSIRYISWLSNTSICLLHALKLALLPQDFVAFDSMHFWIFLFENFVLSNLPYCRNRFSCVSYNALVIHCQLATLQVFIAAGTYFLNQMRPVNQIIVV